MNATFIQIDAVELARMHRDPSLAESLFQAGAPGGDTLPTLSKAMQERLERAGPQMLAEGFAKMDPAFKERIAARLGKSPEEWARSLTGGDLLKLMEERRSRLAEAQKDARAPRPTLSLEKAWHGVHYLLCCESEAGAAPLSHAVLGGTALGADDEGFSGYGPARAINPTQVVEIAAALNRPDLESECAARFDAQRMSELEIYPGFRATDQEWLLDGVRRLREFYSHAAAEGHAIVTCLV